MNPNYFLISLTNKCNKSCGYCVMKEWRNNPAFPNTLTFGRIAGFLGRHGSEGDVVELTGGEPGLFPELQALLEWLRERGFKTIMRTNGAALALIERRSFPNLIIVANAHGDAEAVKKIKPRLAFWDILFAGIAEDIAQVSKKGKFKDDLKHSFHDIFFVSPDCKASSCPCLMNENFMHNSPMEFYDPEIAPPPCRECGMLDGAWDLARKIGQRHDIAAGD
jgi:organic radical activating enzyme